MGEPACQHDSVLGNTYVHTCLLTTSPKGFSASITEKKNLKNCRNYSGLTLASRLQCTVRVLHVFYTQSVVRDPCVILTV